MRRSSITFISALLGLLTAQSFNLGCDSRVKVGENSDGVGQNVGEGDGDGGESPGTGGGGVGGGAASYNALALYRSQVPDVSGGGENSTSTGGGTDLDPNDLFVIISNHGLTCVDPYGSYACGNWRVAIVIPPALQVPGVLDLHSPELLNYSGFSVSGPDDGSGNCYGGGGSFYDGTVEIVSLDATQVVVRFEGTDTSEFDVDGVHTAIRCP